MTEYTIRETQDFYTLSTLFHENGLGVKVERETPDRIVKMWRIDDPQTGELAAAATLEIRDDVYTLGNIAVRNDLQGKGLGIQLQNAVFREAETRGVREVWACAKEPDYYLHNDWQKMDWDTSPHIAVHCASCEKRNVLCHPEIMKYTLTES